MDLFCVFYYKEIAPELIAQLVTLLGMQQGLSLDTYLAIERNINQQSELFRVLLCGG